MLLILAAVSIATITGENGILTRANDAKVQQSHGAVRDGIALAYNEYQIEINTASNAKLASTEIVQIQGKEERVLASYTSFLDFLVQKGYATLDEEDETKGIINVETLTGSSQSLGKGTDADVYKVEEQEGSYVVNYYDENKIPEEIWSIVSNETNNDNVQINVTKTNLPNDEKVGAVFLKVEEVLQNGNEIQQIMQVAEEEYKEMLLNKLETMSDEGKENIFVDIANASGGDFKNFEEFLKVLKEEGEIQGETLGELKESFYENIGGKNQVNMMLTLEIYRLNYNLIGEYDKDTGVLTRYSVTNSDGEKSDTYVATHNGDYTFTVEIDGKQYIKTISVSNIEESQIEIKYRVDYLREGIKTEVGLKDIEKDIFTTFENAYVMDNGKLIDVSQNILIYTDDAYYIRGYDLYDSGINIGIKPIILVKDNTYYYGEIEVVEPS